MFNQEQLKSFVLSNRENLKKYLEDYEDRDIDENFSNTLWLMKESFYIMFPELENKTDDAFYEYLNFPWKNFNNQEIEDCYQIIKK